MGSFGDGFPFREADVETLHENGLREGEGISKVFR